MSCPRCQADLADERTWCRRCELAYDQWSRRNAGDIVWSALAGMIVVMVGGIVVPLLGGVPFIFAMAGTFAGFGTLVGTHRWNRKRRRGQFLRGQAVPRAYLPEKT